MLRKLRLLISAIQSLPSEIWSARRVAAYRLYLKSCFPETRFSPGCIVDETTSFEEGVSVGADSVITGSQVGRYTFIGRNSQITNCTIGRFCSIAPFVLAGLGKHPTNFVSTSPAFYSPHHSSCRISFTHESLYVEQLPVIIGHDVWIGARAVIVDGVTIGNGAIIGTGAVVTKDVEPYSIVGGVPAHLIRKRFTDDVVRKLLSLAWWDRPMEWLSSHSSGFTNVEEFIKHN